jgi:hypothetical protein
VKEGGKGEANGEVEVRKGAAGASGAEGRAIEGEGGAKSGGEVGRATWDLEGGRLLLRSSVRGSREA